MGKSGIKMWKRKILVIESSAADYAEIEEILGETYELRRAEPETREVFTRIREQKPDLILLDTRLPGEGFFRSRKRSPEMRIPQRSRSYLSTRKESGEAWSVDLSLDARIM